MKAFHEESESAGGKHERKRLPHAMITAIGMGVVFWVSLVLILWFALRT
jgi:Na+-transporting methylmalonyl-CoA/oxaloacetate decarboxylase gamma subunit